METTGKQSTWLRVAQSAFVIFLPMFLILMSVRILLSTAKGWMQIEYRLSDFPEDRYGFSFEDRIYWASLDVDYLQNDYGLEFFDDLMLEDGKPMHNKRELQHMEDVKRILHVVWKVWYGVLFLLLFLVVVLWRVGSVQVALLGLIGGARVTFILMGVLILGATLTFGVLFVGFHRIFFEGSTWIFPYSDTFIRLYPEQFWRDTFIYVAITTLVEAMFTLQVARYLSAKTHSG